MSSLLLVLMTLATEAPITTGAQPSSVVACTAQRLRPFVGPTGIHQPWPTTDELPPGLAGAGLLLSDVGMVADGYSHSLVVDTLSSAAYVVQQGGIAGFRKIYGPLPVAACAGSTPNNSFKGMPLRGTP